MIDDTLNLNGAATIAANATVNGADEGVIKSHNITNGIIKFDDVDTFASAVSITSTNIGNVVDYLIANITDGSAVAFLGSAVDPTSNTVVPSTWIFQDNGASDTLVALVGVTTATSLSTDAFSSTAIHLA
jgi:hypothetical protein